MEEARTPKRRLPGPQRSEQILDVAEGLFVRQGFTATSVEDIARAAGISRPIVYEHHGSKDGVYLACVRRARLRLLDEYAVAMAGIDDPRDLLRAGARVWFATVERDPERWLLLFGGGSVPLVGPLGEQFHAERGENFDLYLAVLRQWAAPGTPDEAVAAVAAMITGAANTLASWWLDHRHVTLDQIVEHHGAFCWNGLSSILPAD